MARIDAFLRLMIDQRASDLHFIAGGEPVLRVYGDLLPIQYRRVTTDECLNLVNEILPNHLVSVFDQFNDVDFAYQLEDIARFRVSLFKHRQGVGATFRLIPMKIPTISELNLPDQINQISQLKQGLVLVTGPTGSGKSTTLAAIIDQINETSKRHILTVEDPIEFVHKKRNSLVSQREIGRHADNYKSALLHTDRSSADVILIGEMRDVETISQALTAAETGALVLGTLHTQSCASTISRVVDIFPHSNQEHVKKLLSITLKSVISQRLVRRTKVRGRVPITEILFTSPVLAQMIRDSNTHKIQQYLETADPKKNLSKDACLRQLLDKKLISIETAVSLARDPGKFHTAPA